MSVLRTKRNQAGYSMVEMIIAIAVTTIVMMIIFSLLEEAMTLSLFVESHNDLTTLSQKALNTIQTEVMQAKVVFLEDATGSVYRQKVEAQLPACTYPCAANTWNLPVVAGTQLPGPDPNATIAPDPSGTRYTGNAVLVARQLSPVVVKVIADPTDPTNFPAFLFNADRYRFEYFYLTWHGNPVHRTFSNGDHVLDLWQVRTTEFGDYYQLANATVNMSTAQKQDLAAKLTKTTGTLTFDATGAAAATAACCLVSGPNPPKLTIAWNEGQAFDTGFYDIDSSLAMSGAAKGSTYALTLASGGSMIPQLLGGRIGGRMDYTVAYLTGRSTTPGSRLLNGVPLNDARTNGRDALPLFAELAGSLPLDCGFEVKVAGPSSGRQVMTRLILYSNYKASKVDSASSFVITRIGS